MEVIEEEKPWLKGIEGEYLPKFIECDSPIIRIVAGPGSGKSTGLKRRVQRLIEGDNVDPHNIFIGTFTRAIAQEIANTLEEHSPLGLKVSTLHSLALSLLKDNRHILSNRRIRFLLDYEMKPMLLI